MTQAIKPRQAKRGLVFHSDRDAQLHQPSLS